MALRHTDDGGVMNRKIRIPPAAVSGNTLFSSLLMFFFLFFFIGVKFAILTVCMGTVQWHSFHPPCCATVTTIYFQNVSSLKSDS